MSKRRAARGARGGPVRTRFLPCGRVIGGTTERFDPTERQVEWVRSAKAGERGDGDSEEGGFPMRWAREHEADPIDAFD